MLNMGVIGTGVWGKNHVRVLSELDSVKLVKICDANKTNLESLKNTFGVGITTNYKDILKNDGIEAVSICTPASTHYKLIREALETGKHILAEKPLALSSKKAEELTKISIQNDRILMVGHIFRFHPAINKLKEEIKKGTFGKIRLLYGSRLGLMTPRTDCGVIYDFALHDIDIFCYLLDKLPREVTCVARSYKKDNFEDVGFITLGFDENIIGNIGVSWLTPKKVRDLWIIGEEKSASVDCMNQEMTIYNKGIIPQYNSFGEFRLVTKQEGDDIRPFIPNKEPLKEEISHFVDCVLNGKTPLVDGKIATGIIRIIEKCHSSFKQKRTLMVE